MSLQNHADAVAPVAFGAHPFLRIGDVPTEELTLRVAADSWIRTDERLIPVATEPAEGSDHDFRGGRRVGSAALDVGLTGITPDADGLHRARLALLPAASPFAKARLPSPYPRLAASSFV